MAQTRKETSWPLLSVLLFVGFVAGSAAFWLVDHRAAVRDSGMIISILLAAFFGCWGWALVRYLRWRDRRPAVAMKRPTYRDDLAGTVYGLVAGDEYRVIQPFTDYYANQFQLGDVLRFRERHFLPYDGGHTIVFDQRSLYLQETQNEELIANFSDYIERIER